MSSAGLERAALARPVDLAEARAAVRDSHGALLFRGGGTKLDWGAPPAAVDLVVDTSGMERMVAHNPADATATVQAGMRLADLGEALGAHGQWLAVDPPGVAAGATVGGVVAANDAGPRRLRHGTMRDLVIGATVVLSDGTVARSGGQVIKNVAGYDLAKLWCGSLGTLGLLAEVVVRLHPLAPATATVRVAADAATATRLTVELLAAPVEPHALEWADGALWARFAGRRAAVSAQADAAAALAAGAHRGPGAADVQRLEGPAEDAAWRRLVEWPAGAEGETVVRAGTRPDRLAAAADGLARAAHDAGVEAVMASHAGSGLHTARLSGGDAAGHAAAVHGWRRSLAAVGGYAVVRRRAPGVDRLVDVWGPSPSALPLMRAVKARLDPAGRCAPGRFAGGL